MRRSRATWIGVALGVVGALVGPGGIAVSHTSHPVGEVSHPKRGQIFGTVTDQATGEPLEGICVVADRYREDDFARTGRDGHYLLQVSEGSYTLSFDASCGGPNDGIYASEFFDGARTYDRASKVRVHGLETVFVDVELERGGTIVGAVTEADGTKISTCVDAYEGDVDPIDPGPDGWESDSPVVGDRVIDGRYEIGPLPTGDYRVLVGRCSYDVQSSPAPYAYVPRWLDEALTVAAPAETLAPAVILTPGGAIVGTVRDQYGDPAEGISVWVEPRPGVRADETYAFSGDYRTHGLAPGSYRARTVGDSCCYYPLDGDPVPVYTPQHWYDYREYRDEYYLDAETFEDAKPIIVQPGRATKVDIEVTRIGPDLTVDGLSVDPGGVETALGGVPAADIRRRIRFQAGNLGTVRGSGQLSVWVEPRDPIDTLFSPGGVELLHREYLSLDPAEERSFDIGWTPTGQLGDVRVGVLYCGYFDMRRGNERSFSDLFIGVGGLGGLSFDSDLPPACTYSSWS